MHQFVVFALAGVAVILSIRTWPKKDEKQSRRLKQVLSISGLGLSIAAVICTWRHASKCHRANVTGSTVAQRTLKALQEVGGGGQ